AGAQTSLTNVLATGAMRAINARSANLLGQVNVTGSLNSLSLNFVQAGNITVGGGVGNGALAVNLGRALDTSITSAIPISSLTAAAYLNTDNVPDLITAPAIGTIRVKGTFGGTQVVTASVASVIVGGSIQGSSVLANDRIGVVAALNGISDSTFFAGIRTDLTGALPASTDDFVNKSAAIGRVYVRSGGFSNSLVAGWHVGALSLGNVQTVDGGSTFGVSGDRVAAVVGAFTDASPIHAVELDDPTRSLVQSNFVVRSI
ncbi:MAG TPA: hypothetical protein VLI90_04540, partial [Tepidisphaeraceae bacterium]|nr:hypothetical protein [Tepidisphaeraceae bacterium]